MKRRYHLYAGYHELLVSDRILGRPFTRISSHLTLRAALAMARKEDRDATLCVDRSIHDEYLGLLGLDMEDNGVPVFDGSQHDPSRGLSEVTRDNISRKLDCRLSAADLHDIAHFLSGRMGMSPKAALVRYREKTYSDMHPIVMQYL